MKLIENKKLFGVINLIDIMIVLVLLVAGGLVYKTVFQSETVVSSGAKYFNTTCTMRIDALPEGASQYLEVGAPVYDNETNVFIGTLKEFSSGDYKEIRINTETNQFVESKIPGYESVYATVEVNVSDQGADLITAENYYIKVGKHVNIRSKNFAGGGYITLIEREVK